MIGAVKAFSDRLLGRGAAALTVPPLDGALKPNNRLENAPTGRAAEAPLGLVWWQGAMHWAEGASLVSQSGDRRPMGAEVTAVSASAGGQLAVALAGQGVKIGESIPRALQGLDCVTALAFAGEGTLWIAVGSTALPFAEWSRDFLLLNRKGQVLRYDLTSGSLSLEAGGLGFPFGLLPVAGRVIVAEAWEKRLIELGEGGRKRVLVDDLPGYPAGLAPSETGGFWMALFAPRSPLLELVLREPAYRRAMMAEVDPAFWIAPALSSGKSFSEPMQGGALKQMGILKPWAPTRSYGLVVEMSPDAKPLQSLHSRAGGQRHGVLSVHQRDGLLWVASTGGNEVLSFAVEEEGR